MKNFRPLFTAILFVIGIGIPAIARPTLEQINKSKNNSQLTLDALKRGDRKLACDLAIKDLKYKESTGQNRFWPITLTSAKGRELQHKHNETTARINKLQHENGKSLCGSRWTFVSGPTVYSRNDTSVVQASNNTSMVDSNIRKRCEKEWGTDYEMIVYCIKKQTKAARELGY